MRPGHVAAALHEQGRAEAVTVLEIHEQGGDLLAHGSDVQGVDVRQVGDAQAAADVDELEADAQFAADGLHQIKQHAGGLHHVAVVQFVGGEHGVQAKPFCPTGHGPAVGLDDLLVADPVLGLLGLADDVVAGAAGARVVAEADQLRHHRHLVDQGDIVQVEQAAALGRGGREVRRAGVVRGEHDLLAACAQAAGEQQLGLGAAVEAEAQVAHDGEDRRVGQGLDRVELTEPGDVGKGRLHLAAGRTDAGLVVDVEGRAVVGGDGVQMGVKPVLEALGHRHGRSSWVGFQPRMGMRAVSL